MIWYSKHPPTYIFPADSWQREPDKRIYFMGRDGFENGDEKIPYTKKNIIICAEKSQKITISAQK